MANQSGREALRGVEAQVLDLIFQVLTPEQRANLLSAALELAAGLGSSGLAQKLVGAGAQIGDALHQAAGVGHGEMVTELLENGASINAKHSKNGRTPLHLAAEYGEEEMVKLLILKGADKNTLDNSETTPLCSAAYFGHVAAALALMAEGADVNIRCSQLKRSVVHLVAEKGHVDILRAAIEHGVDLGATDSNQWTALHHAASYNKVETIDALVEAGANIEARTGYGWTSLHLAADTVGLEALTTLIKHGVHVNAQDDELLTPLHFASAKAGRQGAAEVVDALLRSGADETTIHKDGLTAADVVALHVEGDGRLVDDIERVRKLLANAPADRAWRRRGYLALCRAYNDRVQQAQESSSAHASMPWGTCSDTTMRRPGALDCSEGLEGVATDERIGADWALVASMVLNLQEEGIFRTIVGYL